MPINRKRITASVIAQYGSFANYIAALGSTKTTEVIAGDVTVEAPITQPSNITFSFVNDAKLVCSSGAKITNFKVDKPYNHQIVDCALADVPTITGLEYVTPEMFGGGFNDEITDETEYIQKAYNSIPAHGRVKLGSKRYLAVGLDFSNKPFSLIGNGKYNTTLQLYSNTDHLVEIDNNSETIGWTIRDLQFYYPYGSGASAYDGLRLTKVALSQFINLGFAGFTNGLNVVLNCSSSDITGCTFGTGNSTGLRFSSSGTELQISVTDCWFDENYNRGVYCNSSKVTFTGCRFQDNTNYHMYFDVSATNNLITGCKFVKGAAPWLTTNAIRIYGDSNVFNSCTFDQHVSTILVIDSGADNNKFDISLDGTITNFISNNGTNNLWIVKFPSGNIVVNGTADNGNDRLQVQGNVRANGTAYFNEAQFTSGNVRGAQGVIPFVKTLSNLNTAGENFDGNTSTVVITPVWLHYDITHTQLQAATLTSQFNFIKIPATFVIESIHIRPTVQFAGTGITDYKVSVGRTGVSAEYTSKYDVDTVPSATNFQLTNIDYQISSSAATDLYLHAESAGANLDQSTAGTVRVSIKIAGSL